MAATDSKGDSVTKAEYEFTLLLDGPNEISEQLEDRLFEAGCDDATISLLEGRISLAFAREADSFTGAIVSAIKDVRSANVGVINRVDDCCLVTQAEIARRLKRSRQMVHQLVTAERGPGGFPKPVGCIVESNPLWYWSEVAQWLDAHGFISKSESRRAKEVAVINSILEFEMHRSMSPELTATLSKELNLFSSGA